MLKKILEKIKKESSRKHIRNSQLIKSRNEGHLKRLRFYKNKGIPKVATTANPTIQNLKLHMPTIVEPLIRSAEEVAAEKKFNDMMRKAEEEKQRIRNSGIAYLIGDTTK